MRFPEHDLWLAVLARVVQDATQEDYSVVLRGHRDAKQRAKQHGARPNRTRFQLKRLVENAAQTRQRAREWLLAGRDVVFVAEAAGLEAAHVARLVKRLQRNGWKPIGIELGEGLDKLAVRDRELAR